MWSYSFTKTWDVLAFQTQVLEFNQRIPADHGLNHKECTRDKVHHHSLLYLFLLPFIFMSEITDSVVF